MAKTLQELFHARTLRDLFEGEPTRRETTIREAALAEIELREECQRSPLEEIVGAFAPGNHVENHPWLERNKGFGSGQIQRRMEHMRKVHQRADANPEQGALHLGLEPIPDMGGITQPANPKNLCGPFVPVPPDQVPPPMIGGAIMRIESFDDYVARERALRKAEGSPRSRGSAAPTGPVIGTARGFPIVRGD